MSPKLKKQKTVHSTTTTSTVTVTSSTTSVVPVSAIAARRLKLLEAANKTPAQEIEERIQDNDDEEEKASLESGASSDSEDDEDSDQDDEGERDNVSKSISKSAPNFSQPERRDRRLYIDPQSVSTFKPTRYNVAYPITENPGLILVGMKREESIVFQGCATIIPLLGYTTVLGYVMTGSLRKSRNALKKSSSTMDLSLSVISSFTVISPKTHALAVIESVSLSNEQKKKLVPQSSSAISLELKLQLEQLLSQIVLGDFDTVLAIQSASDCGIAGIERVVPLFKGILTVKQNTRLRGTEDEAKQAQLRFENILSGFHPILEPVDSIAAMKIPDNWHQAIQALVSATVDENGQSTKRPPVAIVAFIECDIGQSEFSPVGMVALHVIKTPALGPPFTHPRQPYRAFFVGNNTPKDDPDYYMECIKELVKTYYSEVSHTRKWEETDDDYHSDDDEDDHIPLIINTQGWIKGMGYDLLLQLLDYTAPSHIYGFHSPSVGDSNLPPSFFSAMKEQATIFGRQPPAFWYVAAISLGDESNLSPFTKYHPADHRALSLLSYFYLKQVQEPDSDIDCNLVWDFTQALVVRRPWCWDWAKAKGVWVLFDQVPRSQILHVLNGSLVALTGDKEDPLGEMETDAPDTSCPTISDSTVGQVISPNYFPLGEYPPPPPEHTTCHGLALIRSIEPSTRTLHILTPIPLKKLEKCNGIVKGAIHMPLHANLDHNEDSTTVPGVAGVPWKKVPYLNYEVPTGNYGSQSPVTGGQSPRLGFSPPVKIIGSDAKVTRKNLGRKRLQ
ncbi:Polynucleotide 5'-hydroxyl-kinase grc3 [Entomortierella beljakovae]|nr:Polynucleotide 5'-hydroxyl-kinase grc3 [Entomortierella beljakovae]